MNRAEAQSELKEVLAELLDRHFSYAAGGTPSGDTLIDSLRTHFQWARQGLAILQPAINAGLNQTLLEDAGLLVRNPGGVMTLPQPGPFMELLEGAYDQRTQHRIPNIIRFGESGEHASILRRHFSAARNDRLDSDIVLEPGLTKTSIIFKNLPDDGDMKAGLVHTFEQLLPGNVKPEVHLSEDEAIFIVPLPPGKLIAALAEDPALGEDFVETALKVAQVERAWGATIRNSRRRQPPVAEIPGADDPTNIVRGPRR